MQTPPADELGDNSEAPEYMYVQVHDARKKFCLVSIANEVNFSRAESQRLDLGKVSRDF